MRYYRNQLPSNKLYCSGGRVVKWTSYDGVVGWFATDDPVLIEALQTCIKKKIGGGVEEVTQAEYDDAAGKSKGRRFEPDREWVDRAGLHSPAAPAQPASPVAVDSPAPEAPAPAVATPPKPAVRRRATQKQ